MTGAPAAGSTRPARVGAPARLLRLVRDAWLIFGIALLLLLTLEGAYRLQAAAKLALHGHAAPWDDPRHPYHLQSWYPEYVSALNRRGYWLDPYRGYWLKPLASRWLNIDSAGQRLVPQPPRPSTAREVLLFGGSSMWGLTVRDSSTIASLLARELVHRGVDDVRVVNDAQPGFVSSQELATLMLALAHGEHPAALVFMNGYNDAASGLIFGRPGHTFEQNDAQTLLDLGRRGFWAEFLGLGRHSLLIQRLLQAVERNPPARRPHPSADAICPQVGAYYGEVERTVIAVAQARGIPVLIFQQPHNTGSRKVLTPWEQTLARDMRLAACADSMSSAMAPYAGRLYFDLRPLFDDDTATVFVDFHSHVTEAADGRIAEFIADRLAPLLAPPGPARRGS